jgi:MFS superfamily sulfate permease-like transporter
LLWGTTNPIFGRVVYGTLFSSKNIKNTALNFNEHLTRGAIIITIISVAILWILNQPYAKKWKIIPAPLLVVIVGILINFILTNTFDFHLKTTQLVQIPENIFGNIQFPDFSKFFSTPEIWKDGILIGLLASLETLLCVEAVDKLDKRNRITPINRELLAQGIGNIACGFFGAIPMTAVVVRGAANVDAGGRTKLSAFTHGLFLLLAVLFLPYFLNKIPYASLAAILLITGYNLTKPKLYKNIWSLGWKQFFPFIITILFILTTDLLIGVLIGLTISLYFIIQNNFQADYKVTKTKQHETEVYFIKLHDNVTFLNKVKFRAILDKIPPYSILTIDGNHCTFIDYDILEVISEYAHKAHDRHIDLKLLGIEKVSTTALH